MHRFSNPGLEFVAAPALAPAEVTVDPVLMAQYNEELRQVRRSLLFLLNSSSDCMLAGRSCTPPRRRRRLVISPFTYISPVPNESNPVLYDTYFLLPYKILYTPKKRACICIGRRP